MSAPIRSAPLAVVVRSRREPLWTRSIFDEVAFTEGASLAFRRAPVCLSLAARGRHIGAQLGYSLCCASSTCDVVDELQVAASLTGSEGTPKKARQSQRRCVLRAPRRSE